MRIFKSDGRYKHHHRGLTYIAQFGWANPEDRKLYFHLIETLEAMYGPHIEIKHDPSRNSHYHRRNENWDCEQNKNARRRRIYVRNESDITLLILKA
jgi:hypothetical protein